MNLCTFAGKIVRKPELRKVQVKDKEVSVVNFSLLVTGERNFVDRDGNAKKDSTYVDLEVWDTAAENIASNCDKDDVLLVRASAKNESWVDKVTQSKRWRVKFRVDHFEVLQQSERQPDVEVATPVNSNSEDIPF